MRRFSRIPVKIYTKEARNSPIKAIDDSIVGGFPINKSDVFVFLESRQQKCIWLERSSHQKTIVEGQYNNLAHHTKSFVLFVHLSS